MNKNTYRTIEGLRTLGFSTDEAWTLRRIAMTFHRWDEGCCGDGNDHASWCITRDEKTGKPFREVSYHSGGKNVLTAIPDREKGAEKRLAAIMASHPDFVAYHQTDCRGASLYIIARKDISGDVETCYSRGLAVCA